jgi:hypothetical protein
LVTEVKDADDRIEFNLDQARVWRVDRKSKRLLWAIDLFGPLTERPREAEGFVYAGNFKIDRVTGRAEKIIPQKDGSGSF